MTFDEMKEAWIQQVPVILCTDVINPRNETDGQYEYKRIIGYANELPTPDSDAITKVKLEDKCGRSVTYAKLEDLKLKN
ncbi:MAG: hypothetical protein IJA80_02395 [Clostridia bacterium]|nr:hypothetical protein [Clostridia bacterium]